MEEKTELEWLENWMLEDQEEELPKDILGTIELVFEFLHTRGLLTADGIELERKFCGKYIHEIKKMSISILCNSCIYNSLRGNCKLYHIPTLHDTRFCHGYKRKEPER